MQQAGITLFSEEGCVFAVDFSCSFHWIVIQRHFNLQHFNLIGIFQSEAHVIILFKHVKKAVAVCLWD